MRRLLLTLTTLTVLAVSGQDAANASTLFTWSGVSPATGATIQGTVEFSTQVDGLGYDLVIVFTNTSTGAATRGAELPTAVFFDIVPAGSLTLISATAPNGLLDSTHLTSAAPGTAGTNICAPDHAAPQPTDCTASVAGGWEAAYTNGGIGGLAGNADHGIGTTGLTIFVGNPEDVGHMNYGIAPTPGIGAGANASITNNFPFVYGTATFVLSGLTSADISISNVVIQTGSGGTDDLNVPGIPVQPEGPEAPEPATMSLIGGGMLTLGLIGRKRLAKK